MRKRLGLAWVITLIVVPLLLIAGLTANHAGLIQLPKSAPANADKTPALKWTDIKVVESRRLGPVRGNIKEELSALPVGSTNDPFAYFLGWGKDLSKLDLTQKGDELLQWASFDSTTVWPAKMPSNFSPDRVMELGKDPGLGLRQLHQQGVTGKGVRVAILDLALLWDHQEYAGRVLKYTEVGKAAPEPELHGAAVLSLLAGKTVGVAPEAQVAFYAVQFGKNGPADPTRSFLYMAATINKILDDNQKLPPDQRIRVISASIGAGPNEEGYTAVNEAYRRAMREGVLVVSTDMRDRYKYDVFGLGRDPLNDPNDPNSYSPGRFWADAFFQNQGKPSFKHILAPMDSRTTASETGSEHYRFYRDGGLSWSVPWIAGMYALVCQVDPKVTPEAFLEVAYDTGDTIKVSHDGQTYELGRIANPARIVAHFKK